MQVVINISKKLYDRYREKDHIKRCDIDEFEKALDRCIILPKYHGRLIDENYLLSILQCEEYESCTWRNCSDCNREKCIRRRMILDVPAIVEADKEVSK